MTSFYSSVRYEYLVVHIPLERKAAVLSAVEYLLVDQLFVVRPKATLCVFFFCNSLLYFFFSSLIFIIYMARLAIALLALLGAQLASAQLTSNLKDGQCVQTYDANTDYFPEKLSTREFICLFISIYMHNLIDDDEDDRGR